MRHDRTARSARVLTAAYVAGPFAGSAATLAAAHYPTPALIAALVAVALVITALVWALKQEERR